jgi:hypothetical protein
MIMIKWQSEYEASERARRPSHASISMSAIRYIDKNAVMLHRMLQACTQGDEEA